jgi:hypothetical protein
MSENAAFIDYANLPTPIEGFLVTLFITVRKVARSRAFYCGRTGRDSRPRGEPLHREAR